MVDPRIARDLVRRQFPSWADLPVTEVPRQGCHNRTFRLGERWTLRFPRDASDVELLEVELRCLPRLAPSLPFEVPVPVATGRPGPGFPRVWSVANWIEGDDAHAARVADGRAVAVDLARFLGALRAVEAGNGPRPGSRNGWRGGPLHTYDHETRAALAALSGRVDTHRASQIWDAALASTWSRPPVWVHGDIAATNLVVAQGRLRGVLDFGSLSVGDPACDLTIAWTLFDGESRTAFVKEVGLDGETWARARGWALWKALIVVAGHVRTDRRIVATSERTLLRVLESHASERTPSR